MKVKVQAASDLATMKAEAVRRDCGAHVGHYVVRPRKDFYDDTDTRRACEERGLWVDSSTNPEFCLIAAPRKWQKGVFHRTRWVAELPVKVVGHMGRDTLIEAPGLIVRKRR